MTFEPEQEVMAQDNHTRVWRKGRIVSKDGIDSWIVRHSDGQRVSYPEKRLREMK